MSTSKTPSACDAQEIAFDSGLYIVATPIGNLADMSQRAIAILAAADIVAVEDSRVTGKLLNHLGLKKKMQRYNDYSSDSERSALICAAQSGVVALVSDAGTPLISDPGYRLVRDARAAGADVYGIPGANAAITALSISGLPTDRFLFAGFLPAKEKARRDTIEEFGVLNATLVFYESGPRLGKTLRAMADILGPREAAVARELTKKFEQLVAGDLGELAARYADVPPKGEIVLLIAPPTGQHEDGNVDAALEDALSRLPVSKAAGEVAKRFGKDRKALYARAVELKAGQADTKGDTA